MHSLLSTTALLAYLTTIPVVSAFYPYQPNLADLTVSKGKENNVEASKTSPEARDDSTLRLPLRRMPVKRENDFTIVTATAPTQTDSIGVDQDGADYSYFSAFKFGDSPTSYYLLLDTGAANSWVMGSSCNSAACSAHNTLGPSDSSTLITTTSAFAITYGTGAVNGTLAHDALSFSHYILPGFNFGLATSTSADFSSYPMDGIMGLGRAHSSTYSTGTIIDALSASSLIPRRLFGIHLSRSASNAANDGVITFGHADPDIYTGAITYTPALNTTTGYWEVALDDALVAGTPLDLANRTAVIDTGTSFILTPNADAIALHSHIAGAAQQGGATGEIWTLPCNTTTTLQLRFGGRAFNVSHLDYVGARLGGGSGGAICQSNVIGRQAFGNAQWLVGDVFLKNVYAVFDDEGARVGFAELKGESGGVGVGEGGVSAAESSVGVAAAASASASAALDKENGAGRTAIVGGAGAGTGALAAMVAPWTVWLGISVFSW